MTVLLQSVGVNMGVNKGVNTHALKLKRAHSIGYKTFQMCSIPCFPSRDGGIRTHDLQHPMLARYRATLHPET